MVGVDASVSKGVLAKWLSLHRRKEALCPARSSFFVPVLCGFSPGGRRVSSCLYYALVVLKQAFGLDYRIDIDDDRIRKCFQFILSKVNDRLRQEPGQRLGEPRARAGRNRK